MVQNKTCQNFFHAFRSFWAHGQVTGGRESTEDFVIFLILCSSPIKKKRQNAYLNCLVRMICLCMKLHYFLSPFIIYLVPCKSWFHGPCLFRVKVCWSWPISSTMLFVSRLEKLCLCRDISKESKALGWPLPVIRNWPECTVFLKSDKNFKKKKVLVCVSSNGSWWFFVE